MFSSQNSQVSSAANYIEECFSTYLYTGNGSSSTRSITTGVDSSTYGSLVWIKNRTVGGTGRNNYLTTTALSNAYLLTNTTDAAVAQSAPYPVDPTSTGFNLNTSGSNVNTNGQDYVSWTFRKQPKFFDVVTYTGNGTNRTIAHNLGSVPGCIIVKDISTSNGYWAVYHRSTGANYFTYLNDTSAASTGSTYWNNTSPTSTVFTVGTNADVNASGVSYVAYVFAHNAGGFGLTGADNVISCGSFTTDGAGYAAVTLGYEPQWVLYKRTTGVQDWIIMDNLRGSSYTVNNALKPNNSNAEQAFGEFGIIPTATGFINNYSAGAGDFIYIAIRRGPMKVPTSGTSVFQPIIDTGDTIETSTATFPLDMQFNTLYNVSNATYNNQINDRLRGIGFAPSFTTTPHLTTASTAAETTSSSYLAFKGNGMDVTKDTGWGGTSAVFYNFRRAPSFFDEVCYTGNSVQGRTITHNLGVKPELMFVKSRSNAISWQVYSATETATKYMLLDSSQGSNTASFDWNNTEPTSSVFTVQGTGGTGLEVNWTGYTYVAYLFATCAGVSKVGSYTGTGTTKQVDCGFTGGARFVLIKRTDSTGDWYVWDSARGIVSGNDPYLLLNSTAAETTSTDYIDTYSAGFEISSTAPAAINASGGTFIFLAIA